MFCQRCGQQLKDDSNFCTTCGAQAKRPVIPAGPVRWDTRGERLQRTYPSFYSGTGYQNYGLAAMICGILGAVFFWLIVPGFVLGIVAVVLGLAQMRLKNKSGRAIAGLVLGIAALALTIWIIASTTGDSGFYLNDPQMELNYI
jgi:hypothetical protein